MPYQCKVGSILLVTIAIRLDIAFAVFLFSKFNQRPGCQYFKATNQVFYYLFLTQDYCIRYWGKTQKIFLFICPNDSFLVIILWMRRVFKDT